MAMEKFLLRLRLFIIDQTVIRLSGNGIPDDTIHMQPVTGLAMSSTLRVPGEGEAHAWIRKNPSAAMHARAPSSGRTTGPKSPGAPRAPRHHRSMAEDPIPASRAWRPRQGRSPVAARPGRLGRRGSTRSGASTGQAPRTAGADLDRDEAALPPAVPAVPPPSGVEEERDRARVPAFREDRDAVADAVERQVDRGAADREAADREPVDADRQPRPVDVDLPAPAVDAQAEAGLQQHEDGPRRPGLRQAGDRVGDRRRAGGPAEAAEQLRQPHVEPDGGLEQAAYEPDHALALAVAGQPRRAERSVVRPDRAVVVRHRVEAPLPGGERADAPARVEGRRQELGRDAPGPLARRQ